MTEGSLEAVASERLERVRRFVQAHDASLAPLVFDEPLPTSELAAKRLGVEIGQIAKSILFKSKDRFGLFVAAGDRRIDPKVVKAHLGGKKPRVATPEEVLAVTGYPVGAVCPFALKEEVEVYIDRSLSRFDNVYTAAGITESMLPVPYATLVRITGGDVVDIEGTPRND
jgi:prolyl-tRNA editing enzyme YbaK/EbsC (Cys-tRNA(Pro) deacylase)